MHKKLIDKIVRMYGLVDAEIFPAQKGYRNSVYRVKDKSDASRCIIIYKREPGLESRVRLNSLFGQCLHDNSIPARIQIDPRLVKIGAQQPCSIAGLCSYLPGKTLPWEAFTSHHILAMGEMLGRIHNVQKSAGNPNSYPSAALALCSQLIRAKTYLSDPSVGLALKRKLDLGLDPSKLNPLIKLSVEMDDAGSQFPLHMDFVRGNVLFTGRAISGVIDFEKSSLGHPLLDIARTMAFLRIDLAGKNDNQIQRLFLERGYRKRGQATTGSVRHKGQDYTQQVLDSLIQSYLVIDFYKFLLHNPYEYLSKNYHFGQTVKNLQRVDFLKQLRG